ncbi:MAG: hypothetical protein ACJ788_14120 [Ktedonobacteraceae bacterium]
MRKKSGRHRQSKPSWLRRIPRQVWVLVEVLTIVLVLHYVNIPINDVLPLLKLYL